MVDRALTTETSIVSIQFATEEQYWLKKLAGDLSKSEFPYNFKPKEGLYSKEIVEFAFDSELTAQMEKISNKSEHRLYLLLLAGLNVLIGRYTNQEDIILGSPIYRQEFEGDFVNTMLPLRTQFSWDYNFKDLLAQVRQTVAEAVENQNYPTTMLPELLNLSKNSDSLYETVILLENLQDQSYLKNQFPNLIFSFHHTTGIILGKLEFNATVYTKISCEQWIVHYTQLLKEILQDVTKSLSQINFLTLKEKDLLLNKFNQTQADYPRKKTIQELFEEQVQREPQNIAIRFAEREITYAELNTKANQLAHILQKNGVKAESIVGLMLEPSVEMVISLLAILKAGGAYLPIDLGLPEDRIIYMLNDAGAKILLTASSALQGLSLTKLENFEAEENVEIIVTEKRAHIADFNSLSRPDRSYLNLHNYQNKIGMASVTNCISIQSTRGCPYKCLYCHKIWSKHHVFRSAENIFAEIQYYYQKGVRNFAFIDDCFNLHIENSSRLFKMIIAEKLDLQLFFPNGLRGDILQPEYIDLMVEAGTRGINLSLETGSPRLQKLLQKNLDLDKFKFVIDYIAAKHPNVILELATMHGFPTETEEEAMMTLNFIKDIKWLHFPYIHILKIFPNTEMEDFALANGITKEKIMVSKDRAFHELPETLPFPKSFTRKYQANFLNEYFLEKERLKHVLPVQMKVLSEEALVQKYNAYLPVEINSVKDVIDFAGLADFILPENCQKHVDQVNNIFTETRVERKVPIGAKKVLLLDLSQMFSSHSMLYKVTEQPLGLIYLLTYLKEQFGEQIEGRVHKSGVDFDNYAELHTILEEYQPDLIGIRTLTYFREFFHETVAIIRQWGIKASIITGGPYASSDYDTILKDKNVDLVAFGEGEEIITDLVRELFKTDFLLPSAEVLAKIPGIAFVGKRGVEIKARQVILLDQISYQMEKEVGRNPDKIVESDNLAYVMYTSGSTGKPKGVMVEHRQVNNCIFWMQQKFQLTEKSIVIARTNLTFDPSVWEIFWPLYVGGSVRVLSTYQRKDAEYLINLMKDVSLTMMYCPATLLSVMVNLLNKCSNTVVLRMPWLLIGAEPISMEVVKNFYKYYQGTIVNTYGPTECTINNTYYELSPDEDRSIVPIGRPVANNQLYILGKNEQLMPLNAPGEICIAGESVARGYINNPEKTKANFLQNPFQAGKLYRTGDIGRWLLDGTIEILGRVDEQVKIRGYRIEPGEIETALRKHGAVKDCVVIVRDPEETDTEFKTCRLCGITTNYPGVKIDETGVCGSCHNFEQLHEYMDEYFKNLADLKKYLQEANIDKESKYDCLLVYNGGRGAAYALYQLVELGFKVMVITYDNGYFSKAALKNIKEITTKLGVDHEIITHPRSKEILKESLKTAHTVCRGCFHTSASIAGEYALRHKIKVVVGATLSRGQIIENKLLMFLNQGITNVQDLEREVANFQQSAPEIDKNIFGKIDIEVINNKQVYHNVKSVDFYRFCDISNEAMIDYLNNRDPYWKTRRTSAIYSTNCPIKQVGDFAHLKENKFHYYGSATSWEKRLGHLSLENVQADLKCTCTAQGYANFLKQLDYEEALMVKKQEKYLCAYYVTDSELSVSELRDYLTGEIPEYMIPAQFMGIKEIPLTSVGKVDKKALPKPEKLRPKLSANFIPPTTDLEISIAEVWKTVLGIEEVGINDNFFDLGGSSLDIIQVGSKLKEKYEKELTIVTLFNYPTISTLAGYLNQKDAEPEADRSDEFARSKDMQRKMRMRRGVSADE